MDPNHFTQSTCFICGDVKQGRFRDAWHYCDRHQRDEVDFHQCLPDGRLSAEQKQLRAIYRRRWQGKKP